MPIELRIGGEVIALSAKRADVQRVVACAYLVGGFSLVLTLMEQVLARARGLGHSLKLIDDPRLRQGAGAFRERGAHEKLADWEGARRDAPQLVSGLRDQLKEADAVASLVRRCWASVAEAEEEALAQYERMAIDEFKALAKKALEVVKAEWQRYAPHEPGSGSTEPMAEADARKLGAGKLQLAHHREGLLAAVVELKRAAVDYAAYLESARNAAKPGYTSRNAPTKNVWKTLVDAQKAAAQRWGAFEQLREKLGREYPVALQVYGQVKDIATWRPGVANAERDRSIETWVIEAMLDTLADAPVLIADAERLAVFKAGAVVRRRPEGGVLAGLSVSGIEARAQATGLVLPASRVVVDYLQQTQVALKSVWLQRPVRFRLRERATGLHHEAGLCAPPETALAPYFEHGRLHQAALAEIDEGVADQREAAERQTRRALMVMDAIALPAAFFTGGLTAILAGGVHAAVRASEMGVQLQAYFAEAALAGMSFSTLEDCMWKPPSTLRLAGTLLEGGFDIGSSVVGGRAGAALDALQTVLAIGHGASAVKRWIEAGAQVET